MQKGTVKFFNQEKGYGFISHEGGDIFFHFSKLIGWGERRPEGGEEVTFEIGESRNGGKEAISVKLASAQDDAEATETSSFDEGDDDGDDADYDMAA